MKNTLKCLSVALLFSAAQSWAVDRYISDELFTYMHSGPSAQYRITGSINAGSKVTLLESNRGGGYSKVRDNRGRTGWVSTKFVTRDAPALSQLPVVQKALNEAKSQLAAIDAKNASVLEQKEASISAQENKNQALLVQQKQLIEKINELKAANGQLQTRLDNQSQDIEMKWMINGGLVIFAGIVIGLIIPHLPRRKKNNSQWA